MLELDGCERCSTTSGRTLLARRLAADPRRRGARHRRASRATGRPSSSRSSWACAGPRPGASSSPTPISPTGRPGERREAGIGYMPEDRQRHGMLLDAPLWENRILGHQSREPVAAGMWLDRRRGPGGQPPHRRAVRRPHPRRGHHGAGAVRVATSRSSSSGREMSGDPVLLDRLPPDPGRGRRCAGRDLGPHPRRPPRRARGAAHQRRPRRADRALRHHPGACCGAASSGTSTPGRSLPSSWARP